MRLTDTLLVILLSPILLIQGWYVRKKTPKLPEPEGARTGTHDQGPKLRLLILGDSAAAGVGVASQSQALSGQICSLLQDKYSLDWCLLAQSGYRTQDLLERLRAETDLSQRSFDLVLISLGVNDVISAIGVKAWIKQQQQLLQFCRQQFSSRQVLFSLVPPMGDFPALPQPLAWVLGRRSKLFNQHLIHYLRSEPDCQWLELGALQPEYMAEDGFHPGAEIYHHWAQLAVEHIS